MIIVVICGCIVILKIYLYPDLHARLRKGQKVAEARATPITSEQYESVSAQDQVQGW